MPKKKIEKAIEKIRDSCDDIEEEIQPKKAELRGDPIVRLH